MAAAPAVAAPPHRSSPPPTLAKRARAAVAASGAGLPAAGTCAAAAAAAAATAAAATAAAAAAAPGRARGGQAVAAVTYARGGAADVTVAPVEEGEAPVSQLLREGWAVLRGHRDLAGWVTAAGDPARCCDAVRADAGRGAGAAAIAALSDAAALPRAGWSFRSSILRHPDGEGGQNYGGTVHRDLDEAAAENLRREAGGSAARFYNVWLALGPVPGPLHALGFVLPGSVRAADRCSFHPCVPTDGTGLAYSAQHRWRYAPLAPGDALIFDSARVYHASLDAPSGAPPPARAAERRSVDLRVTYLPP